MNAFAESAAIHTLLCGDGSVEIPSFRSSLMPVVDVVRLERTAFDAWCAGDATAAISGFADAAEQWAARHFVRFAARCSLAAGQLARRVGDHDLARVHVCAAGGLAERWRLTPVLAASADALAGLDVDRHRARLSPREVEVLDLVGAGRTTAEIAAQLGVGESTVITHVNSARVKLGAQTRRQAASMVAGAAR